MKLPLSRKPDMLGIYVEHIRNNMNGAESLIRTLIAGGVNTCFTNPGTSEMHIVAALDHVHGDALRARLFSKAL